MSKLEIIIKDLTNQGFYGSVLIIFKGGKPVKLEKKEDILLA